MQGLQTMTLDSIKVVQGTDQYVFIEVTCIIINPSAVAIALGPVRFLLYCENQLVGYADIADMTLQSGVNQLKASVYFCPDSSNLGSQESGKKYVKQSCF
jgi:hypothetical protein